jgi:nucleoside-diphosphate-sugar epimerase
LSYVANCAEAIVFAAGHPDSAGQAFNVHDDDLPTASRYLRLYKKDVKPIRSIRLPYLATRMLATFMEHYNRRSHGQLPAVFTRYKVSSSWGGNCFSNAKLRAIGWRQLVSTQDAMAQTFEYLRTHPAKG